MVPDWRAARAAVLLDESIINLNTGSFGPLPRAVFDRATELRRQLAAEPTDFFIRRVPPLLWHARCRLARFLNADPARVVFSLNVSTSINLVAASLRLAAPGEILLTDHEYGAMHWCWERAAIHQRLTLRTFPLPTMARSPDEIVEAVRAALTDRTRLLFFSHVLSPTGLVLPAREICAEARRRGVLTVVDGAHAPAMLPLDVAAVGADFYAGNCHKWLLAPSGAGFLHLGAGNEDRLQAMNVSWGWHHDRRSPDEPTEYGSTPRIRALEFEGTYDCCPWLTVPDAIDFQAGLGWDAIRTRMAHLAAHARARLDGLAGLTLATPAEPGLHAAMTAFNLPPGVQAVRLKETLFGTYRIEIPVVERPDRLLLRVSTHFYNTEAEIDRLAEVLPTALREAGA